MIKDISFFKFKKTITMEEMERITHQICNAGFHGDIKVYHLGYDSEDSISLIIEGRYKDEECCLAAGYGMNRQHLAIRTKWYRHAPPSRDDD